MIRLRQSDPRRNRSTPHAALHRRFRKWQTARAGAADRAGRAWRSTIRIEATRGSVRPGESRDCLAAGFSRGCRLVRDVRASAESLDPPWRERRYEAPSTGRSAPSRAEWLCSARQHSARITPSPAQRWGDHGMNRCDGSSGQVRRRSACRSTRPSPNIRRAHLGFRRAGSSRAICLAQDRRSPAGSKTSRTRRVCTSGAARSAFDACASVRTGPLREPT